MPTTIDLSQSITNALREKHPGKSVAQMARESKVPAITLNKAMKGEVTPRYKTLARIAAYCDLPPQAILNGYGAPEAAPRDDAPRLGAKMDDAYRRGYVDGFGDGFDRGQATNGGFSRRKADAALN